MERIASIAAAAAVAAAFTSPAALALHRCVGKDGKVTYTEFECDADAKKSAVTIRDSAGVESKKPGDPAKDAKAGAVLGGPTIARPAEMPKPVAVPAQPTSVQQAAPGAAVGAASPAKPGQ